MRTIHIAEQCHEGLSDLQRTMSELRWTMVKETIPYQSSSARTHWALNAGDWIKDHSDDDWVGVAYLDDAVLYARFKDPSDATAFRAACQSNIF